MTTGIHAILADLLALAIWLVIMASLLTERREKRYLRIIVSLIFGALGLFLLVRSGEKLLLLARLHSLNMEDVSFASFGDRPVAAGGTDGPC